jgi:hypothetical protein
MPDEARAGGAAPPALAVSMGAASDFPSPVSLAGMNRRDRRRDRRG